KWRSLIAPSTQPSSSSQPNRAAIQSSPTIHDDLILFGDMDGVMHAIAKSDGREKWTYKTGAEIISSVNCFEDRALFGSYDGFLYCLDVKTGKEIWKFETEGKVHATPGIWIDMRHVAHAIIAGCDARMRAIRISDGKQAAEVEIGGYCGSSPAMLGGRAFVGTFSNQIVGVDLRTGDSSPPASAKLMWTFENPDRQFPYLSSAALGPHALAIGSRDKLIHCLDYLGKQIWEFPTKGRVDSSPVIVSDRVFVGSSDGTLYAIDLASGKERWRYEAGGPMSASPAVADSRLVIGTEDGAVLCFGAPEARK
ncbi:MAG TPA: PQQ-binding-like beta-propeller repeat protein, partial [Phycisphaerae bacterium]|nr:PQQ-binding-like beta-propeller repeat protein [Phycisphaerae bacterium]